MSIAVGCVAEGTPKYMGQALRLVQSIRWFGGALNEGDLYVCVVEHVPEDYRQELERYGAIVRVVPRFSVAHPPSNKLRFLELPELSAYDKVLLLDCDTLVVRDPTPDLFRADFSAKIADAPTVPVDIFRQLFSAFGLAMPGQNWNCTVHGEPTIPYFNAGVLAFSGCAMSSLVPVWIMLNEQLIERMVLLEEHGNFCEQASLALALVQTDMDFYALSNAFNFPLHFEHAPDLAGIDPYIIHYHWLADDSGHILPSQYPAANKRIGEFNARLRVERESRFDNRLFWNQRYEANPALGSGVGSRGEVRDYKRRLLENAVGHWRPRSILDVGCGDMEVGTALPAEGYTGLDFSEVAVSSNRMKHPDRRFVAGNFIDLEMGTPDMVVCLDVLIHLASREVFRAFVRKLIDTAGRVGIVAGDEADPGLGGIVFFHEPLSHALVRAGARNLRKVGSYRHVAVFEFNPPSREQRPASPDRFAPAEGTGHPRDISREALAAGLAMTVRPDLLQAIVALSRRYLGFFTSHFSRTLEYPWILQRLEGHPPGRLLDIGAGVCPVPLALAEAGHRITTVDPHLLKRSPENRGEWNEWGFLDYRQLHPNITSKHMRVEDIFLWRKFDVVYSISVVEYMPATVRRKIFAKAAQWLAQGGLLLLTLDLFPMTEELWNRSEGAIVDRGGHGSVADICRELMDNGFGIDCTDYFRSMPESTVDVVCIAATLLSAPGLFRKAWPFPAL
jgi:2-polyprenyl-3-methyl-5-hydroxy-6-metoxy-1,4-benzoquinol methylase